MSAAGHGAFDPLTGPALSVLTVAGDPARLRQTFDSLLAQGDARWEWCLAGPSAAAARAGLPADARVRVADDDGEAWSAALRCATGEHVLLLAAGDRLTADTVSAVAAALRPGGWGYSDELQEGGPDDGDVWLKPDWAPELLRSQPYPVRTAFLPRGVLEELGGLRAEAGTAAPYDAVLRVSEVAGEPVHLRRAHVVRTDPDVVTRLVPGRPEDHVRAVRDHCARVGIAVESIAPLTVRGRPVGQRLHRPMRRTPSVSLVIPTRGGASVVRGRSRTHVVELLESLWVDGRYSDLEVVVVHDADTPPEVLDRLRALVGEDLVLSPYDEWFSFSRKCNQGALVARGEYLCFLNDDMEIGSADWLHQMVPFLDDPGVVGVGARLVFDDGTIQHAGHQYRDLRAGHPLFGWPGDTVAMGAMVQVVGERSGVTAACLLVRAEDFRRVGGFSPRFPLNYNDVDLCLKLRARGGRLLYTPDAVLYHFESQTRVPRILDSELTLLELRWGDQMRRDPFVPARNRAPEGTGAAGRKVSALEPSIRPAERVKENHE